jgi:hypothetical protein
MAYDLRRMGSSRTKAKMLICLTTKRQRYAYDGLSPTSEILSKRTGWAACALWSAATCVCGVTRSALMVRVGPEAYQQMLTQPHVRPLEFAGRRPRGFVLVDPTGPKRHWQSGSSAAWTWSQLFRERVRRERRPREPASKHASCGLTGRSKQLALRLCKATMLPSVSLIIAIR